MSRAARTGLPSLWPVAAALGLGALAARALPVPHGGRAALQLGSPLPVVDAWGRPGIVAFAVLAGAMLLAAAAAIAVARRPDGGSLTAAAVAGLAACLAWPYVFSSDAYAYAAYGTLALHGVDPYVRVTPAIGGPAVDAARFQWGGGTFPPCVYGPAFVVTARAVAAATAPLGLGAALWTYRVAAAAAFAASVPIVGRLLAGVPAARRRLALTAYALDPAALWGAAEGHNDAELALVALAGAALALRARSRSLALAGAALVGFTAAYKVTGIAFAAGLAVALAARRDRTALGALGAGLAVAIGWALPPALETVGALRGGGRYAPETSLAALVGLPATLALAAAALAVAARHALNRDRRGYAWLGVAAWLALPNPYPWYALWALPAVAIAAGGFVAGALWAATILAVVRYLPDAAGSLGSGSAALAAVVAEAPLLFALGAASSRRFRKKALPGS